MTESTGPQKTLKRSRRANMARVDLAAVRAPSTIAFWSSVQDERDGAPPVLRELAAGADTVTTIRGVALAALRWARAQPSWPEDEQAVVLVGARVHAHQVKVTVQEEGALARLAAEQGVSVPRLLVESALSPTGEGVGDRRDAMRNLFAVRRQLAGLTTNVNQIARAVNTDGRLPVGTAGVLRSIEDVVDKIDAAIDGLARS